MFTRKFVSYESEQNEAVPSRMSDPDQLEKKTRLQRHGPDSVHSWMTAGACGLSSFFASCAVRSGGFVFVAVQENWQTSRRDAAWPVLMMAAGTQASGVLSGPLAQRFTVRPVTIAGSIMSSIGLVLSSFAPSTTVLTVTLGAIHGYFRDQTGSYDAVFQLCGFLQLLCFLLWLSVCVAERLSKRRKWSPKDELDRAAMHVCKFVYLPGAGFAVWRGYPCYPRDDAKARKPSTVTTLGERSCSVVGLSYGTNGDCSVRTTVL
ncbi:uncharacterized protein LOC119445524 isoform X2 [Dermacentor silvarum]|uniref:uncharacterized protein LOC119445524 isoform X2 n=1 Tax=Dermacentor silvarum TaxID=543639 RepID=UPI002101638B|nr:uncharacterized protein LOC119445524 isoform X2 [Dermacentor silvarum]